MEVWDCADHGRKRDRMSALRERTMATSVRVDERVEEAKRLRTRLTAGLRPWKWCTGSTRSGCVLGSGVRVLPVPGV
jgi:hypothetical protein